MTTPAGTRSRRSAVLCVGLLAALGLAGCGSSADDAVKAPVTVTAPATTVTVTATGTGRSAATVSVTVTETATVTESVSGSGGTVTETVTESADPVESSTATAQSSPTGLKVGAGVTATDDDGVAAITVVSAQRKTTGTGDYSDPPKNGNYLLVDVSYTCTSGKIDYNPFDWKVRDKDGRTFDSSGAFSSGYDDGALHSGTIAKGGKARGIIVFDVPKGAVTLEYGDGYDQAPASWNIPA